MADAGPAAQLIVVPGTDLPAGGHDRQAPGCAQDVGCAQDRALVRQPGPDRGRPGAGHGAERGAEKTVEAVGAPDHRPGGALVGDEV